MKGTSPQVIGSSVVATIAIPSVGYEQSDPDVQLMLRVREGDCFAFEELVARYQGRLLTILENLVNSREQAEDLTQDVFLRVFRARQTYEPGARFSTWLFTIANNVASNARRDRARRKEVGVPGANPNDSSPLSLDQMARAKSGLMPARRLDKVEQAEVVKLAMESLNERQRMALLLAKFEEMSYEDIGKAMGLSVQAVKSLLSRARANLRDILAPYMETGERPDRRTPNGQEDL